MKKKSLFLVAVILVLLVTGCSLPVEPETKTPTTPAETTTSVSKPLVITTMHYNTVQEKVDTWEAIQKLYTEAHPNVTFENQAVIQSSYISQLRTRIAADDMPNIMHGQPSQYPDIIETGNVLDLTDNPVIAKLNLDKGDLGDCSYQGKVYGIPLDFKTYGVFYNKGIFDKYGLKEPKTHAELIAVCEELKKNGVNPWVMAYKDTVCQDIEIRALLWPELQKHNKFDAFEKLMNGSAKFSDYPEFRHALELWTERIKDYRTPNDLANDQNAAAELFGAGNGAMLYIGTWLIGTITNINPDLDLGFFTMPNENSEDNRICVQVDSVFMIRDNCPETEESVNYMAFMLTPDIAKMWAEKLQLPSVVKGLQVEMEPVYQTILDIKSSGTTAHAGNWTGQLYGEYLAKYRSILQKYSADQKYDIDSVINELQAAFDTINQTKN